MQHLHQLLAVADREPDLHAFVFALELRQQRRQPAGGQRRQCRQRDAAAAARHVFAQIGQAVLEVAQQPRRAVDEEGAFGGEADLAGVALEQPRADRFFQRADQRAEGGL